MAKSHRVAQDRVGLVFGVWLVGNDLIRATELPLRALALNPRQALSRRPNQSPCPVPGFHPSTSSTRATEACHRYAFASL